jgi:hypothetical protein
MEGNNLCNGFFDPRLSNFQKKRLMKQSKGAEMTVIQLISTRIYELVIDSVTRNPVSRVSKLAYSLVPHPCKKRWKVDPASSPKHRTPYEAMKTPGPGLREEPRAESNHAPPATPCISSPFFAIVVSKGNAMCQLNEVLLYVMIRRAGTDQRLALQKI